MTYDEWFRSKQGEPYDSMFVFARDAWQACSTLKDARIKELELWRQNVDAMLACKISETFWRSETAKANKIINECESALKEAFRQLVCTHQDRQIIYATRMCSDALRIIKAYRAEGETE